MCRVVVTDDAVVVEVDVQEQDVPDRLLGLLPIAMSAADIIRRRLSGQPGPIAFGFRFAWIVVR